jgi:putative transposase
MNAAGFAGRLEQWVVEWTVPWFGHNRRLAKAFENTIDSTEGSPLIVSIHILTLRIARA